MSTFTPAAGRVCASCGTTTTPLWRNGPLGPKTLCNACGVRDCRRASKGWISQRPVGLKKGGGPRANATPKPVPAKAAVANENSKPVAAPAHNIGSEAAKPAEHAGITTRHSLRRNESEGHLPENSSRPTDRAGIANTAAGPTASTMTSVEEAAELRQRSRSARAMCRSASLGSLAALIGQPIGGWEDQKTSKESTSDCEEEKAGKEEECGGSGGGGGGGGGLLEWDRVVRATLISPSSASSKLAPAASVSNAEAGPSSNTVTRSKGMRHAFNQQVDVLLGRGSGSLSDATSSLCVVKSSQPSSRPTSVYMRHQYTSTAAAGKSASESQETLFRLSPSSATIGDAQYRRSTGTLVWWAPMDTAHSFPTAWGLEFATREQYLAFKVLLSDCYVANQRAARVQVHIPKCYELSQEEYEGTSHSPSFVLPEQYIPAAQCPATAWSARGWLVGAAAPLYTVDDADLAWLASAETAEAVGARGLSELQYERLVDHLEQASVGLPEPVGCETILSHFTQLQNVSMNGGGLPSREAVFAAHEQWLLRRAQVGGTLCSRYQPPKGERVGTFMCGQEHARAKAVARKQKAAAMKNAVNQNKMNGPGGRKRFKKKALNAPTKKQKTSDADKKHTGTAEAGTSLHATPRCKSEMMKSKSVLQMACPQSLRPMMQNMATGPSPTNVAAVAAAAAAAAVAAVAQQVCNAVCGKESVALSEAISSASAPRSPAPPSISAPLLPDLQNASLPVPSPVKHPQVEAKQAGGYDTEDSDSDDEYLHGWSGVNHMLGDMDDQTVVDGSQFLNLPPATLNGDVGMRVMNTDLTVPPQPLALDMMIDVEPSPPGYMPRWSEGRLSSGDGSLKGVNLDKVMEPFVNMVGDPFAIPRDPTSSMLLDPSPIEESHNQTCSTMNEGSRTQTSWSQSKIITCP